MAKIRNAGLVMDEASLKRALQEKFYETYADLLDGKEITGRNLALSMDLASMRTFRCVLEQIDPKFMISPSRIIDAISQSEIVSVTAKAELERLAVRSMAQKRTGANGGQLR